MLLRRSPARPSTGTGADAIRLDNGPIGARGAGTIGFSAETGPVAGFIEAQGVLGGD